MFNYDTSWKNIFYFIQKCYGIQELDIFKIHFIKSQKYFFQLAKKAVGRRK